MTTISFEDTRRLVWEYNTITQHMRIVKPRMFSRGDILEEHAFKGKGVVANFITQGSAGQAAKATGDMALATLVLPVIGTLATLPNVLRSMRKASISMVGDGVNLVVETNDKTAALHLVNTINSHHTT